MTAAALPAAPARWSVPYAATLARIGRLCVAGALIAFAIANVVVGDFVPGRAPAWPVGAPGRLQLGGAWTMLGKSLAVSGVLGVAASMRRAAGEPMQRWMTLDTVGRWSFGAFFLLAGIQHYLFAQFVKTLVPAWIPGALLWTYVAGAALIASGLGLALRPTARVAAALSGAMVLSWLFVLHIPRGV